MLINNHTFSHERLGEFFITPPCFNTNSFKPEKSMKTIIGKARYLSPIPLKVLIQKAWRKAFYTQVHTVWNTFYTQPKQ